MSDPASDILIADWPAPAAVRAITTKRKVGGVDFNLAAHAADDPATVAENRRQLLARFPGITAVQWLSQVHGTRVIAARGEPVAEADGSFTGQHGLACAVLTADCLPVLLCDREGTWVAALHAGWRGLCNGILVRGANCFPRPDALLAWLGPAIGGCHFEVGAEVREAFLARFAALSRSAILSAFAPIEGSADKYFCDLAALARMQLQALGLVEVYGGECCTVDHIDRFYSHRAEAPTGRNATLIWLDTQ